MVKITLVKSVCNENASVKAAVAGLVALKSPEEVAAARGKSVEEILG